MLKHPSSWKLWGARWQYKVQKFNSDTFYFPLNPRKRPVQEHKSPLNKRTEPVLLSCTSFTVSGERMWTRTSQNNARLRYTLLCWYQLMGAKPVSVSDVSVSVMCAAASSCLVASLTRQLYGMWRVFGWWPVLISNRTPKPWHRCLSVPLIPSETGILHQINPFKTNVGLFYIKTQFVPYSKHFISVIETYQFML